MPKAVYKAVTRARHQCEAGLFVPLQALANEKILTCLDTYQACVPARVVLTLPRACTKIHTSFLPSKAAFSLRLPPGLRRDSQNFEIILGIRAKAG